MFVIALGLLIIFLCVKLSKTYNFWKNKNVIYIKPWPLFGNFGPSVLAFRPFANVIKDLYEHHPNEPYVGIYQFVTPLLMIRDPELIKQILVKEFDSFSEHRTFIPEDAEPLWGKNLIQMPAEKWREMRPVLSPVFTSGKIKLMFTLMTDCAEQFVKHYLELKTEVITLQADDAVARFANDMIARAAYGITCDSLTNKNNEFFVKGQDVLNMGGFAGIKFFLYCFSPLLVKALKIKLLSEPVKTFFTKIVLDSIKVRRDGNVTRPDLIHLLMEAQKNRLKYEESSQISDTGFATAEESSIGTERKNQKSQITDEDIVAQALLFFLGGFQTVTQVASFLLYELMVNHEIQDKLRKEVDQSLKICEGKITHEALLNMKYLDMVISETLRKWPPGLMLDRKCVKPFTIPSKKNWVKIDVGTLCMIPVIGIHHNPKYYPNPERFDPERFNNENKKNILPGTYLPFGFGPRNCIGSRFALLELKVFIFHVLTHFKIVPVEKTQIPVVLDKTKVMLIFKNGLWVGFKRRRTLNEYD